MLHIKLRTKKAYRDEVLSSRELGERIWGSNHVFIRGRKVVLCQNLLVAPLRLRGTEAWFQYQKRKKYSARILMSNQCLFGLGQDN